MAEQAAPWLLRLPKFLHTPVSKRTQKDPEDPQPRGESLAQGLDTIELNRVNTPVNFIYYDQERLKSLPPGLSKLAAEQALYPNRPMHRAFEEMRFRVLIYEQQKIHNMECRMLDQELEAANEQGDDPALTAEASSSRHGRADVYDAQLELAGDMLIRYDALRGPYRKGGDLPRATHSQLEGLYTQAIKLGAREEDLEFMRVAYDFVTPKQDLVHQVLGDFLYKNGDSWLLKPFRVYERGKNGEDKLTIDRDRLDYFLYVVRITGCCILTLTPALVLYLAPMTKAQSAGFVTAVLIIFVLVLCLIPDRAFKFALGVLAAFMAVLVTFLAQLPNGG